MRGGSQDLGSRTMKSSRPWCWRLGRARRAIGAWQAGKGSMFLGGGRGSLESQGRGVGGKGGRCVVVGRGRVRVWRMRGGGWVGELEAERLGRRLGKWRRMILFGWNEFDFGMFVVGHHDGQSRSEPPLLRRFWLCSVVVQASRPPRREICSVGSAVWAQYLGFLLLCLRRCSPF